MQSNKVVLVTGGSRGLGKDMAISIAKKGIDVILTYRDNKELADETAKEIEKQGRKAIALRLNMSAPAERSEFISQVSVALKQLGSDTLYGFVNNAGMGATVPFAQVTEEIFEDFLNVHFKGVYFLTQQLLPLMQDGASIVNISTGTTRFCVPGYSVYASMKGAIEVFTRYLAKEFGAKGIRANVVAPGPVETDFNSAAIRSNPQMKSALSSMSPLGRVGNADDIGSVVAFLLTDEAKWVNGQRIEVSGGINV